MNALNRLDTIVRQVSDQLTRSNCEALFEELERLERQYGSKPEMATLFNMMKSLGNYLYSRLEKAHPGAAPMLAPIADAAAQVLDLAEAGKSGDQEIVRQQVAQFRSLQSKLSSSPQAAPADVENLKAVILSIDWEITDQTLNNFEVELNHQLKKFNAYNIHHTFLKMIHSIGRYVASHKAKAHADSIFFLRSVFADFEQLILSPQMPLKEKKALLESDLKKFQDFKHKIAGQTAAPTEPVMDDKGRGDIPPALSHVKPSTQRPAGEGTLTSLDEDAPPTEPVMDNVTPALAGKRTKGTGSTDVMDDLFSIKESPADELLDAIHLLDVHGSNPADQALNMLNASGSSQADGVKNYTPQRSGSAPIPEIGDRLDAFFNLDAPTAQKDEPPEPVPPPALDKEPGKSVPDGLEEIVPFDGEDEDDTLIPHESSTTSEAAAAALERLKAAFASPDQMASADRQSSIEADIRLLTDQWKTDTGKQALLEIIADASRILTRSSPLHGHTSEKKGLWKRVTSLFSS